MVSRTIHALVQYNSDIYFCISIRNDNTFLSGDIVDMPCALYLPFFCLPSYLYLSAPIYTRTIYVQDASWNPKKPIKRAQLHRVWFFHINGTTADLSAPSTVSSSSSLKERGCLFSHTLASVLSPHLRWTSSFRPDRCFPRLSSLFPHSRFLSPSRPSSPQKIPGMDLLV